MLERKGWGERWDGGLEWKVAPDPEVMTCGPSRDNVRKKKRFLQMKKEDAMTSFQSFLFLLVSLSFIDFF